MESLPARGSFCDRWRSWDWFGTWSHYERFIDINLNKYSNVTTGKIYSEVLRKDAVGEYLGGNCQLFLPITDALKRKKSSVPL